VKPGRHRASRAALLASAFDGSQVEHPGQRQDPVPSLPPPQVTERAAMKADQLTADDHLDHHQLSSGTSLLPGPATPSRTRDVMRLVVHRQIGRPTLASPPRPGHQSPRRRRWGRRRPGRRRQGRQRIELSRLPPFVPGPLPCPLVPGPLALGAPLAPAPAAVPVLGAPGRASLSRVPPGVAVPGLGTAPAEVPATDGTAAGGSPSAGPNLDARRSTQNHPLGTLRLSAWRSHNGQTWAAILRSWGPASLASSSNHAQRAS
jgi:hypothetical protein